MYCTCRPAFIPPAVTFERHCAVGKATFDHNGSERLSRPLCVLATRCCCDADSWSRRRSCIEFGHPSLSAMMARLCSLTLRLTMSSKSLESSFIHRIPPAADLLARPNALPPAAHFASPRSVSHAHTQLVSASAKVTRKPAPPRLSRRPIFVFPISSHTDL